MKSVSFLILTLVIGLWARSEDRINHSIKDVDTKMRIEKERADFLYQKNQDDELSNQKITPDPTGEIYPVRLGEQEMQETPARGFPKVVDENRRYNEEKVQEQAIEKSSQRFEKAYDSEVDRRLEQDGLYIDRGVSNEVKPLAPRSNRSR